jgi:gluconate 5-dehydrogenase
MLSARKADELEQAVAELQAAGIDARWIAADCARKRHRAAWPTRPAAHGRHRHPGQQRRRQLGRAGRGAPVAAWDKVMNLNVRGYFILSQQVARGWMIPRGAGASSTWPPSPGWAATRRA